MRGTLAELVAIPGMPSEPTLRKMITSDPDFEGIIKRGSNGDAYEIELDVAVRYIVGLEERKAADARARQSELAQLGLDLGLTRPAEAPGLSIADRKAMLEEEIVAHKLSKMRGELVSKASVEAATGQLLVWLQHQQTSFSGRLAKRADVPRQLQIEIDRLMADDQVALVKRLQEWAEIEARTDDVDGRDLDGAALDDPAL